MVELRVSFLSELIGLKSNLPLSIDVVNDTDVDLPNDLRLIFKENSHYYGSSLLVGRVDRRDARPTVKRVNMTLDVRGGANADTLQPTLDFELHSKSLGRILTTRKVTLHQDFYRFTADLNRFAPNQEEDDPPLNILIFGPAGAGKSAWLNTAFTLSSASKEVNYHVAMTGPETVRLQIICLESHDNIALWDTWGVDSENYKPAMLSALLKGHLPNNWERTEFENFDATDHDSMDEDEMAFQKPHAVIFFLTLGDIRDCIMIPVLQQHFQAIKRHKLNPIVVIARADHIDPAIRSMPNTPSAAIEEARMEVAAALGVDSACVFPGVPYLSERQRSFEIDRLTYKILNEAVRAASANYKATSGLHVVKDNDQLQLQNAAPPDQLQELDRELAMPSAKSISQDVPSVSQGSGLQLHNVHVDFPVPSLSILLALVAIAISIAALATSLSR